MEQEVVVAVVVDVEMEAGAVDEGEVAAEEEQSARRSSARQAAKSKRPADAAAPSAASTQAEPRKRRACASSAVATPVGEVREESRPSPPLTGRSGGSNKPVLTPVPAGDLIDELTREAGDPEPAPPYSPVPPPTAPPVHLP